MYTHQSPKNRSLPSIFPSFSSTRHIAGYILSTLTFRVSRTPYTVRSTRLHCCNVRLDLRDNKPPATSKHLQYAHSLYAIQELMTGSHPGTKPKVILGRRVTSSTRCVGSTSSSSIAMFPDHAESFPSPPDYAASCPEPVISKACYWQEYSTSGVHDRTLAHVPSVRDSAGSYF